MIKESKYIIRRVIVGVLIALILSFVKSCEVKAVSVLIDNVERQYEVSTWARFYSLNGRTPTFNNSTHDATDFGYYITTDTVTQAGSGELICFNMTTPLVQNTIYSISILLGSSNSSMYFQPNIHYPNLSIGTTTDDGSYRWSQGNYGIEMLYGNFNRGANPLLYAEAYTDYYYGNTLVYIFKALENGNGLCVPFNAVPSNNTSNTIYYGYAIDTIGYNLTKNDVQSAINSSGLASASSIQQIQNSINAMQSSLNSSTNSINSNIDAMEQTLDNDMKDINDTLNNDDVSSADSKASEWSNKNLSDNVVSDMVTMPITLMRAYLNGINGTCHNFSLGTIYDHELILPCINLQNYFGTALWSVIDILFSGFMIFAIGKKFVKIFNDFTNLKDNQVDELYGGGN